MKIAVIGGGSTYTPELLGGLIERAAELGVTAVHLHDVRADRLEILSAFSARMVARAGAPFRIESGQDLGAAVDGAKFVLTQIRVGGQEARHDDIQMGLKHGLIGQETTGVGGMAKALRTIPEILRVADEVRRRAPEAWIVNFTNPSGVVTEALHRYGGGGGGVVRSVGLCNIPTETKVELANALGVPEDAVDLDYVGLNHLAWVRRVWVDGRDRLPEVLEVLANGGGPQNIPEMDYGPRFLKGLGALPSPYLRYYYATGEMLEEIRANPKTRAQEVMAIEDELLAFYAVPENDVPPPSLSKRGGAYYSHAAVELMRALLGDEPKLHVVNVAGGGAVPGFDPDASVEIAAQVSSAGVVPRPVTPVEPRMAGLMHAVKAYETLTVEAAVETDPERRRERALMALVAHPLVPSVAVAERVLGDLTERGIL